MSRKSDKITLRSYVEIEKVANAVLKEKGKSTAKEIAEYIDNNYNIANRMGVTSHKIKYYLKKQKYRTEMEKGKNVLTFYYD